MPSWLNACLCSAPFLDSSATWRRFAWTEAQYITRHWYLWDTVGIFHVSPLGCLKGVRVLAFPWLWLTEKWDGTQDIRHILGHHLGLVLPPCKHQFSLGSSRFEVWWGWTWGQLIHPPPSPRHSQYPLWCILGHSVVRVNKLNYTIVSVEAEQLNTQTPPSHTSQFAELFTFPPQPATMRRNLVWVSLGRQSSWLRARVKACGTHKGS